MRIGIVFVVLVLAGCSSVPREPLATPEPETVLDCRPISNGATAALQWGFDERQPDFTVTDAQSLAIDGDEWLVAASFTGPGVPEASGVWFTVSDPAVEADNAFLSVDAVAREFTVYVQPEGWSSAPDIVEDARSCLE